jgi:hypothetical protein
MKWLLAAAALIHGGPALACTPSLDRTDADLIWQAQNAVVRATAIIDGEVVREANADGPAVIRVLRVYKGQPPKEIKIGYRSSCDSGVQLGQSGRMYLEGGPDLWFLPIHFLHPKMLDDAFERMQKQK